MNLGLQGKRALVLAASSGLGRAIAAQLAGEGAQVALCSRDLTRASEAAADIEARTGQAVMGFEADVSDQRSLQELVAAAVDSLGGLDLLVCNAGGPPAGNFKDAGEAEWTRAFELTLMSVVRSVKLALPHFSAAGGGAVLVLGSSSVKQPISNLVLSNVYRPAIHGLVKHLADELAADGVRVNMISPGRIITDRTTELDMGRAEREGRSLEDVRAEAVSRIPLGRMGDPEEFANVAVFLLSRAASYVTGESIIVDGGMVRAL